MKNVWLVMLVAVLSLSAGSGDGLAAGLNGLVPQPGSIPGLAWVHEGTVVTSRWYTAKLVGSPYTMKQDDSGTWTGSDGRQYNLVYHGDNMDAGGLIQNTVVAMDGNKIVLKTVMFASTLSDPMRKAPRQGGEIRALVDARESDFCRTPDELAKLTSDASKHIYVSRVRWPEGDQLVDAIRIDRITSQERILVVFDSRTGLGLHLSSLSDAGGGDSVLMEYNFAGTRDMHVPWGQEPIPQAVRNLKSLHLSGTISAATAFAPPPTILTLSYSMVNCSNIWAEITSTGTAQSRQHPQPMSDKQETGYYGNEFGGLWIGPGSIPWLQQGQVLDVDPITKIKRVVSRIDNQVVGITESNSMSGVESIYDRTTGLLVESNWYDAFLKATTNLRRDELQ